MSNRKEQKYEKYWQYTAAKTMLDSEEFIEVLDCCVKFFDEGSTDYAKLQDRVASVMKVRLESVRKMINQLVKLGFLKPKMQGYRAEAKEYIAARSSRKRTSLLSKTVYKYSDFNNSMSEDTHGAQGQINFFLKTLENVGSINTRQLTAMMSIDVADYPAGYMTAEELDDVYSKAFASGFVERKYNQIDHLKNLLSKLDDICCVNNVLYFKTDAARLFGEDTEQKKLQRDPYLQRVYKSELEDESISKHHSTAPKCMVEGLAYPVLIASHIKPYKDSSEGEAFDHNNGLLLSKNMDSLFDLGYITFADDGAVIMSRDLREDVSRTIAKYTLDRRFINPERMKYMEYHRENVFQKRYAK